MHKFIEKMVKMTNSDRSITFTSRITNSLPLSPFNHQVWLRCFTSFRDWELGSSLRSSNFLRITQEVSSEAHSETDFAWPSVKSTLNLKGSKDMNKPTSLDLFPTTPLNVKKNPYICFFTLSNCIKFGECWQWRVEKLSECWTAKRSLWWFCCK